MYGLEFTRAGELIYWGMNDRLIVKHDIRTENRDRISCGGYVTNVRFSGSGKYLAVLHNLTEESNPEVAPQIVTAYRLSGDRHEEAGLPSLAFAASSIATSKAGSRDLLAVGDLHSPRIAILDMELGEVLFTRAFADDTYISSIAFSSDGDSIVAGLGNGKVVYWDLQSDSDESAWVDSLHAERVHRSRLLGRRSSRLGRREWHFVCL